MLGERPTLELALDTKRAQRDQVLYREALQKVKGSNSSRSTQPWVIVPNNLYSLGARLRAKSVQKKTNAHTGWHVTTLLLKLLKCQVVFLPKLMGELNIFECYVSSKDTSQYNAMVNKCVQKEIAPRQSQQCCWSREGCVTSLIWFYVWGDSMHLSDVLLVVTLAQYMCCWSAAASMH